MRGLCRQEEGRKLREGDRSIERSRERRWSNGEVRKYWSGRIDNRETSVGKVAAGVSCAVRI